MRTKKFFGKLLITLLIIFTVFNFISSVKTDMNYSFADTTTGTTGTGTTGAGAAGATGTTTTDGEDRLNELANENTGIVGSIINGIKWLILAPFRAARSINYSLASAGGAPQGVNATEITPFDIFFNKFPLLDANIFRDNGNANGFLIKIKSVVPGMYTAVQSLAIAVSVIMFLLCVVVALSKSTSPEKAATAKNNVKDWFISFVLIIFMHFLMSAVLYFNDIVLDAIQSVSVGADTSQFLDALENAVFASNIVVGVASLVVYAILNWQTLKYIIIYFFRLATVSLLVIFAPVVAIKYSTDKIRSGNSLTLNKWFGMLCSTVFIQILHALIYSVLVGIAITSLNLATITKVAELGPAVVAVLCMLFIERGERMARTIFGLDDSLSINNIMSNTFGTITRVASSAVSTGQRVATGGPLVSFGRNIDGSHIGIGQVAQGVGNRIGNLGGNIVGGVRNTGVSIRDGFNNALDRARGIIPEDTNGEASGQEENNIPNDTQNNTPSDVPNEATNAQEENGGAVDRDASEDNSSISEEESLRNRRNIVMIAGGKKQSAEVNESMSRLASTVNMMVEKGKKKKQEQEKQEATKQEQENSQEKQQTTEQEQSQSSTPEKQENNTEKNNSETIETESIKENNTVNESENKETINQTVVEQVEPEEIVEENEEENNEENNEEQDELPVIAGENVDPELFEKFKSEFKAIILDQRASIDSWGEELQDKVTTLEKEVDEKTRSDILKTIEKNKNNEEFLKQYLQSLKDGSKEKEYATAVLDVSTYLDLDDENKSDKKDKIDALISAYNVQGLEIPKEYSQINDVAMVDKMTLKSSNQVNAKPEVVTNEVKEVKEEVNEPQAGKKANIIEIGNRQNNSIDMNKRIKDFIMKDLADLDPQKYKVKGEFNGNIQTEYESKIQQVAKRIGAEPDLTEIFNKMDRESQERLVKYNKRELSANELDPVAKDMAILERQAMALGYRTETTTKFNANVDGRTFSATSTGAVVKELRAIRQSSGRNITVTGNNVSQGRNFEVTTNNRRKS